MKLAAHVGTLRLGKILDMLQCMLRLMICMRTGIYVYVRLGEMYRDYFIKVGVQTTM